MLSACCAGGRRFIRDRDLLSRVVVVLRDLLLSGDGSGHGTAVDSGDKERDREFVGGPSALDRLDGGSSKPLLLPAIQQDDHPARELVVHCLCLLLGAEMADIEDGDVPAYSSTVTSDLLTLLSTEMTAPMTSSSGEYNRIRRRISRIGGKFKRGVARLSLGSGNPSAAAASEGLTSEVDAAVSRAIAVVDLLSRVVCFIDHPLLTLAAGEVLVDHFSRDSSGGGAGGSGVAASGPGSLGGGNASGSSGQGSARVLDDLLKAEVATALANIAVLSSQVRAAAKP